MAIQVDLPVTEEEEEQINEWWDEAVKGATDQNKTDYISSIVADNLDIDEVVKQIKADAKEAFMNKMGDLDLDD